MGGDTANKHLTLGCISTGAILHQHVVEGLMVAMRQTVNIHVADPLMAHHAGGVPAIDHTVVSIPVEHGKMASELLGSLRAAEESGEAGWGSSMPFVHYLLLLPHVESLLRNPVPLYKSYSHHQQSIVSGK